MKKFLVLLLMFLNVWAVKRMVVGEYFTSTTQIFPYHDTAFDHIAFDDSSYLAVIRYHVRWPQPFNDPFWENNLPDNDERITFYNVTSIPQLYIDGQGSSSDWKTKTDSLAYRPFRRFSLGRLEWEGRF